MANSKKTVQVRCVVCRLKTPMFNGIETLTTKMEKRGWKVHKDGRFTCPAHAE